MKRFLSMILAVLMIVPMLMMCISAAGSTSKCTVSEKNCAAEAAFSFEGAVWYTRKNELVDGDKSKGMAGSYHHRETIITMFYEDPRQLTDVVVTVNSEGTYYGTETQPEGPTNSDFDITVIAYDENNNEVYSSETVNSLDRTDIEFAVYAETKTLVIKYTPKLNAFYGIWEIEAYERVGEHAWSYSQTQESTCKVNGYDKYECDCGKTMKEELPLRVYHRWDEGTVETPVTESTEGKIIYTCLDCKTEKREVTIPATVHNEWDEGVVTAPTCTEEGYTTYTCTHCSEGVTKLGDFTNPIGHDIDDGTPIKRPNFTEEGKTKYECQRDGCDYSYDVTEPISQLTDSKFVLGLDQLTITETDLDGNAVDGYLSENAKPEEAFDGLIMQGDIYSGDNSDNYWKAPVPNNSDPDNPIPGGGKLILEFDYEYLLLDAKFYVFANYLGFEIEFFNAAGESVLQKPYANFSCSAKNPLTFSKELFGTKIKKIVITAKTDYNKTMALSELEIVVHKCLYDEADKADVNTVTEECKTTFTGTCWMCKETRSGVTVYEHTYEQENGADKINITTQATCYSNGAGTKTCTVCKDVCNLVIPATGDHNFDEGKEEIVIKENCGIDGEAYKICATPNCNEQSEHYALKATGKHSYQWKNLKKPEPDYTHAGMQSYICRTCNQKDPETEDKPTTPKHLDCVFTQAWSIRKTGYTSARATFKLDLDLLESIKDEYNVKVYGVVIKDSEEKLVQVYGDGANGKISEDGVFSLVVKNAGVRDEFNYEVRVEIECISDRTTATSKTSKKTVSGAGSTVSTYDVAKALLKSEVDEAKVSFYQSIVDSVGLE